jgi:hypothetical protein
MAYNTPPITFTRGQYLSATQDQYGQYGQNNTQTTKRKTPQPVPAWAFWGMVAFATLLGIVVAILWYFLQQCRKTVLNPTSICPTVLAQTCSNPTLPACKSSCSTTADCPSGQTCGSNNTCG